MVEGNGYVPEGYKNFKMSCLYFSFEFLTPKQPSLMRYNCMHRMNQIFPNLFSFPHTVCMQYVFLCLLSPVLTGQEANASHSLLDDHFSVKSPVYCAFNHHYIVFWMAGYAVFTPQVSHNPHFLIAVHINVWEKKQTTSSIYDYVMLDSHGLTPGLPIWWKQSVIVIGNCNIFCITSNCPCFLLRVVNTHYPSLTSVSILPSYSNFYVELELKQQFCWEQLNVYIMDLVFFLTLLKTCITLRLAFVWFSIYSAKINSRGKKWWNLLSKWVVKIRCAQKHVWINIAGGH